MDNGQNIGNCAEVKYCYSLQVPPKFDHTNIAPIMDQRGFIRKNGNPLIPLQSATGSDIYRVTRDFLGEDLYGYVANKEEVKAWVEKGMAEEIDALDADERWSPN